MDYENALKFDFEILPFFDEWYYSNVADEHMAAMTFAAIKLHREQQVIDAFTEEQERIMSEGGNQQRSNYCELMKTYLRKGMLPYADKKELHYQDPMDGKTITELSQELKSGDKKLDLDSVKGKYRLYYACCTHGFAKDVIEIYEQIQNEQLGESLYENAIIRYLYLGEKEEAIRTTERLATARLWAVAAPTQVRPMRFFQLPYIHDFLSDEQILKRIREAAYINAVTLVRK